MPAAAAKPTITRAEVHEALERLYDGPSLAQVTLAARLPAVSGLDSVPGRALKLRALLLDAIELLQPARSQSFRSAATRSYDVIAMHFVRGLSMARVAAELYVSERQVYRDLAHAEARVAEILSTGGGEAGSGQRAGTMPQADPVRSELQGFAQESGRVDVAELLSHAVRTVAPLAERLGVSFDCSQFGSPILATGDEALLRATFVQMLSIATRHATGNTVSVAVRPVKERVTVVVTLPCRSARELRSAFGDLASLMDAQRLKWSLEESVAGTCRVSTTLSRIPCRTVLLLEDNPSAVELYRRYLSGNGEWELVAAPTADAAIEIARQGHPAVIVLDLLMPAKDGWQVLQTLRALPETADIPVLICSVFDESDLASALGANNYLKKPVSREQFLAGLRACAAGRRSRP